MRARRGFTLIELLVVIAIIATMNWRTKNVKQAAYIPAFADRLWVGGMPHHTDDPPQFEGEWSYSFGNNMKRFCLNRHNEAINMAMLDWSVRHVRLKRALATEMEPRLRPNRPLDARRRRNAGELATMDAIPSRLNDRRLHGTCPERSRTGITQRRL